MTNPKNYLQKGRSYKFGKAKKFYIPRPHSKLYSKPYKPISTRRGHTKKSCSHIRRSNDPEEILFFSFFKDESGNEAEVEDFSNTD